MSDSLRPGRSSVTYCVRAPLTDWLQQQAVAAARTGARDLLDVGCGDRRYEQVFTAAGLSYVGCDAEWNPAADVHGFAESLPVEDASFDVVVSTQVLEHVPDPAAAVRELRRVLRPGGLLLASTHGTAVYHPSPTDFSRWTHAGLEKLLRDNGSWSSISVVPAQGTAATVAMFVAHLVDLALKRVRARPLAKPLVAGINVGGELFDRAVPQLARPVPGSLHATFHIEARATRPEAA